MDTHTGAIVISSAMLKKCVPLFLNNRSVIVIRPTDSKANKSSSDHTITCIDLAS